MAVSKAGLKVTTPVEMKITVSDHYGFVKSVHALRGQKILFNIPASKGDRKKFVEFLRAMLDAAEDLEEADF